MPSFLDYHNLSLYKISYSLPKAEISIFIQMMHVRYGYVNSAP